MAQRITNRDIEGRLEVLNSIAKEKGARFRLGGAYGKSRIEMFQDDDDRWVVWSQSPLGTKRETYDWLNAFLDGMAFSRRGRF